MTMELGDRADGVKGHYCIQRSKEDALLPTVEFYSEGKWVGHGAEVFVGKEVALQALQQIKNEKAINSIMRALK